MIFREVYRQMKIRILPRAGIWLCILLMLVQPAAAEEEVGEHDAVDVWQGAEHEAVPEEQSASFSSDSVRTAFFVGLDGKPAAPVASVSAGDVLYLPRAANTEDYTFLGWSEKPGKKTDPEYLEYQRVRLLQNKTFYGVYYPNKEERDLTEENFATLDTDRYKLVIFAGDSRFSSAQRRMEEELGDGFLAGRFAYVLAQSDISLAEFVENTSEVNLSGLTSMLDAIPGIDQPIAVVVNLGTNDLKHIKDPDPVVEPFLQNLQILADRLASYRVKLFFMSINPVSGEAMARRNYAIYTFNQKMKDGLPAAYTYIDTFSWLMKYGFTPRTAEDGVHYSVKTGKRIFDYAIRFLNMP